MTNLKALEIWTAQTACGIGILLSVVSALLHVGRPYFERILSRLTLRVAADLWWLAYVMLRDAALFAAVVIGVWHLNLDLMADIKVGLPFVPLGTVVLAAALLLKVFVNTEDPNRNYRLAAVLVTAGASLNFLGYALVMEGPGKEYPASSTAFWILMESWRSNKNPALATTTFYIAGGCLTLLALIAVIRSLRLLRHSEAKAGA